MAKHEATGATRKRDQPRHSIIVYAVKADIQRPEDIIKPRPNMVHKTLRIGAVTTRLYVTPAEPRIPRWAKFLGNRIDAHELGVSTSSAAAVLLVPTLRRTFALTFGFGRHMLNNEVIEERYGLKATLNAIDPKSIRSLDLKSFESLARQIHEQATRPAEALDFGLDIEQDMLRAVVGTPRDRSFASRMHGKDAIVANINHGLEGLVGFLERCETFAGDVSYRKTHPWVDHIAEISDKPKVAELDAMVVERIKSKSFDDVWLAVPEPVDWSRVDGFTFTKRKGVSTAPELRIADFIDTIDDLASLSTKTLRRRQAYVYAHDLQHYMESWAVYKCLCFETTIGKSTFLLSGGKWYRIDFDFAKTVDAFVKGIPISTLELPDCVETDEGDYNERVCKLSERRFVYLDKKLVTHGGGHSSIEVCDFLTDDRRLVHVKKYGGSSLLSHLFSQALVSGELLFSDAEFRQKANRLISKTSHKFSQDDFNPRDYEVVLGIITSSKNPFTLPFFSRVNLRAAARRLRSLGYKVTLLPIRGPA